MDHPRAKKHKPISLQSLNIYKISNIMIIPKLIPNPLWQYHGCLGLGLILHIQGQYEEPRRIGYELPCKEMQKNLCNWKNKRIMT